MMSSKIRFLLLLLILVLFLCIFPSCGKIKLVPGTEPASEVSETQLRQMEGYYESVAFYHPEFQRPDIAYAAFWINGNHFWGFRPELNEWEDLGAIEEVSMPEEITEMVFQDIQYSEGYLLDPPSMFQRLPYRAISANAIYYFDGNGIDKTGSLACVVEGRIVWFIQTICHKDLTDNRHRYICNETGDPLPQSLDFDIYQRTYSLYIPSTNFLSEGSIAYEDNGLKLVLTDAQTGSRCYFSYTGDGYLFEKTDFTGSGLKADSLFTYSAWFFTKDLYGVVECDLDGDGYPEKIMLGDLGFAGILGLDLSIDGKGEDAYQIYTAKRGDIELVEEDGHVYGVITYHPFRKEDITSKFEIHYDGERVWITDGNGVEIMDEIDLEDQAE